MKMKMILLIVALSLVISACVLPSGTFPQVASASSIKALEVATPGAMKSLESGTRIEFPVSEAKSQTPPAEDGIGWPLPDDFFKLSCEELFALWIRFTSQFGTPGSATGPQMSENGDYGGRIYNHLCFYQHCSGEYQATMTGSWGNPTYHIKKK